MVLVGSLFFASVAAAAAAVAVGVIISRRTKFYLSPA